MTVALADAFGPKVRVNCILPGAILTDIADAERGDQGQRRRRRRWAGRLCARTSGAALFFASEASAWITGTVPCASMAGWPASWACDGGDGVAGEQVGRRVQH